MSEFFSSNINFFDVNHEEESNSYVSNVLIGLEDDILSENEEEVIDYELIGIDQGII